MKNLIFTLLLTCLYINTPLANDAYVVNNVTVKLEGENPEELRKDALSLAKKEGLTKLLQQVTPESDWGKHAWVLADESAAHYIQSISVEDERAADGQYEAKFNVIFDPIKTRRMFLKHKLNFSEASNRNVMLLPIWQEAPNVYTLRNNPWYGAMLGHTSKIRSKLGVSYWQDNHTKNLTNAQISAPETLLETLERAERESQVALSVAAVTTVDGSDQLTITTTFADARQMPIAFSVPVKNNITAALNKAAREFHKRASKQLLTNDVIRADQEQVLFIRFKATRVQDIERMEQALENISVVADVSPRLISAAESVFMVHMYSDVPAFLGALERAGLSAEKQGNLYQVAFN